MPTAYIVDCVRTPGGKRNGALSEWHPADLGAVVINALLERNGMSVENGKAEMIDDVIFGCVSQVGAQAGNLARNAVLSSKLPESVPGTSVDRQCGSSQQALHFAAHAVSSGFQDVVIAGGVEVMSKCPIGSNIMDGMKEGHGVPFDSEGLQARYPGVMFSQFSGAEMVAEKAGLSREDMERCAVESHRRADRATREGRFDREIIPVKGVDKNGEEILVDKDEGIRWPTSAQTLSRLRTLRKGGRLTAATSSQITDGASAVLICNERGLTRLGLSPRAKVVSLAVIGSDPVMMLYGPVPASKLALQKAGLRIGDIDLYEVNEAFASVPMCFAKELGADAEKLNVNGGAMALGHPLGATGTKLMATLVCELERTRGRFGLQAICEGGGTANACVIERVVEGSWRPVSHL
jgi:acetyl-CoA acetyltransferase family protein